MSLTKPSQPAPTARRSQLSAVYFLLALALLSAGYFFGDDLKALLGRLESLVVMLGPAAPVGMAIVCGLWGVLCLPGPLMQGAVGTLFATQPPVALAVVVAGETLAQTISFLVGRFVGRDKVQAALSDKPWFKTLEEETLKKGFYGVFVFRLMPFFPNALASYAFGLTSLRFLSYLLASFLGSFPKMVMYIYGTTSFVKALKADSLPSLPSALLAGVGVLIVGFLANRVRRATKQRGSTKASD